MFGPVFRVTAIAAAVLFLAPGHGARVARGELHDTRGRARRRACAQRPQKRGDIAGLMGGCRWI